MLLLAAVGIDAEGTKHPLGVVEGATENAATVQALLDNLIGRGLDPAICRLFIVDGAKAADPSNLRDERLSRLGRLGRFEVDLDCKLERTLAMLSRIQNRRMRTVDG